MFNATDKNTDLLTSFANENYEKSEEKTTIELAEASAVLQLNPAKKKPELNHSSSVIKVHSIRDKNTAIMCGLVHVNSMKYERFSQTLRMLYPFVILIVLVLLLLFVFRINIFV